MYLFPFSIGNNDLGIVVPVAEKGDALSIRGDTWSEVEMAGGRRVLRNGGGSPFGVGPASDFRPVDALQLLDPFFAEFLGLFFIDFFN